MRLVDGGFLVNFIVECLLDVMKLSYCLVVEMKSIDTIQFLNMPAPGRKASKQKCSP